MWKGITEDYDAVVDFCVYEAGDIDTAILNIAGNIKQYIMISTVDVYKRCGDGNILKDEGFAYEERCFFGDEGAYILGKVATEKELIDICKKRNIVYTILRPSIIYGPYNYAPRENMYFRMIREKHVLPVVEDATGQFQFVYVRDAVRALEACLGNGEAYNRIYNICNPEIIDYERFYDAVTEVADVKYHKLVVNVEQTVTRGLPAPFPLMSEETELCDSSRSLEELHITYTALTEGLRETWSFFH
jgi:nucleoside-diphosphate-sugar epimerase